MVLEQPYINKCHRAFGGKRRWRSWTNCRMYDQDIAMPARTEPCSSAKSRPRLALAAACAGRRHGTPSAWSRVGQGPDVQVKARGTSDPDGCDRAVGRPGYEKRRVVIAQQIKLNGALKSPICSEGPRSLKKISRICCRWSRGQKVRIHERCAPGRFIEEAAGRPWSCPPEGRGPIT